MKLLIYLDLVQVERFSGKKIKVLT